MKCLVFNGWAAGPETWALCTFPHDWVFDYVEQLDGLPEKVMEESDEVILVGFSMGGSSALRMWLKYPEKVKGLVLISATPRMMEERRDQGSGIGEQVAWRGMSERRLAALRLGTKMMFRDDPSPMYDERNMERGLDYLKTTDLREALQLRAARRDVAPYHDSSLVPHPSSLIPVFIFQSERDGIVRPNNAEFLKQVFPQATVTMVPGNEREKIGRAPLGDEDDVPGRSVADV